uniref:Transcription elongation factor A protein-like 8 n=1 Tax=Capra hircus TaxID=9925 RepID=A0A452EG25_CAPHI
MQKSCEENKGKPQNMPQAEEDLPLEAIPQEEAEGNLRGGLTQPDPEEMIRGTDELERLREEIRRTRSKFVMMHWKQGHHNSISLCPASFCTPRPNLPVTPGVS